MGSLKSPPTPTELRVSSHELAAPKTSSKYLGKEGDRWGKRTRRAIWGKTRTAFRSETSHGRAKPEPLFIKQQLEPSRSCSSFTEIICQLRGRVGWMPKGDPREWGTLERLRGHHRNRGTSSPFFRGWRLALTSDTIWHAPPRKGTTAEAPRVRPHHKPKALQQDESHWGDNESLQLSSEPSVSKLRNQATKDAKVRFVKFFFSPVVIIRMGLQLLILQMMELRRLTACQDHAVFLPPRSRLLFPGSFPKLGRSSSRGQGSTGAASQLLLHLAWWCPRASKHCFPGWPYSCPTARLLSELI